MGLFKRSEWQISPVSTELTAQWFAEWVEDVRQRKDRPKSLDWAGEMLDKAFAVIDHDCVDYVQRYCPSGAAAAYARFTASRDATPWGLVSFVAGCKPDPSWPDFIVTDAKAKLAAFADVYVEHGK